MNTTPSASRLDRFIDGAVDFIHRPASPRPLAALRIGLSAVLIMQAISLAADLQVLYGRLGIIQWDVMDPRDGSSAIVPGVPRIRWLSDWLATAGVSVETTVRLVFLTYVASLSLLLFGWRTRITAATAWLTHLCLNSASPMGVYGVDQFANIALFYCTVMPVGHYWSADARSGRADSGPTSAARLGLRVLQIHLCIVYLTSGLEKAAGIQWWNGEAIWRAVNLPELVSPIDFGWLASAPWLAAPLCWATLAVEIGYPVLVWPRATCRWMALATVGLHAGIAVGMGLYSFAGVMMVLTTSAFLISSERSPQPLFGFAPRDSRLAAETA